VLSAQTLPLLTTAGIARAPKELIVKLTTLLVRTPLSCGCCSKSILIAYSVSKPTLELENIEDLQNGI